MSRLFKTTFAQSLCLLVVASSAVLASGQEGGSAARGDSASVSSNTPVRYTDTGARFYDDKERGWHWYEDPLEDELQDKPPAPPPAPPEKPKAPEAKAPEAKPAEPAGPPPMSAEWLKTAMPKYLTTAIDKPSDENVKAFLYLQRYALDKAQNYALATQRVTSQDPYLDMNVRRPMSTIGSQEADQEGLETKLNLIKQLRKTSGILFFFRGDCRYCHAQWPMLSRFAEVYKFSVIPVSLDGAILDGMDPKKVQLDKGQAQMMGVQQVPSMYLLQPPGKFAVVSYGLTAVEGFPDLVLQAAVAANLIDEKMLMQSRGVRDKSIRTSLTDDATEEIANDPVKLVEYMKKKLKSK